MVIALISRSSSPASSSSSLQTGFPLSIRNRPVQTPLAYQFLKGLESTSTMVPFTMTPISLKSLLALLCTTFKMGHSNSTSVETK